MMLNKLKWLWRNRARWIGNEHGFLQFLANPAFWSGAGKVASIALPFLGKDKGGGGGGEGGIISKEFQDPLKYGVASPLSRFLAENVGKGLPKYEGDLYEPLDPYTESKYSDFMKLDPGDWFEEAVGGPETKRFKEELLPEITEGYAGSLRGSGRYRAEEAGIGKFSEYLAGERARQIPAIAQAQFGMGMTRSAYQNVGKELEYKEWMRTLPETNPILDKALAFLSGPTGRDIAVATDPGQKSPWMDLLGMGMDIWKTWQSKTSTSTTTTPTT